MTTFIDEFIDLSVPPPDVFTVEWDCLLDIQVRLRDGLPEGISEGELHLDTLDRFGTRAPDVDFDGKLIANLSCHSITWNVALSYKGE